MLTTDMFCQRREIIRSTGDVSIRTTLLFTVLRTIASEIYKQYPDTADRCERESIAKVYNEIYGDLIQPLRELRVICIRNVAPRNVEKVATGFDKLLGMIVAPETDANPPEGEKT